MTRPKASRTCRKCPRVIQTGRYCGTCQPVEYDTAKLKHAAKYDAAYLKAAARVKAIARRNWKTSRCGLCGRRLFDDNGKLIGRQLHADHLFADDNTTLQATHSKCNEAAGQPQTRADALGDVLGPGFDPERP